VLLEQTGFGDIVMSNEVDVFSGSKHESDAKDFDTRGVTVFPQASVVERRPERGPSDPVRRRFRPSCAANPIRATS